MTTNTSSVYILGAGSIGLLWACRLAEKGCAPLLITRELEPTRQVTRNANGQRHSFDFETCSAPLNCRVEFLFITTKAHQTQTAVTAVANAISENAVIVLLQNGMGNAEWLAAQFPHARIYLGTTTDGVFRNSKMEFTVAGLGETYFGPFTQSADKQFIDALIQSAPNSKWDDNIESRLWHKLAVNCVINPLAALYECKNGELITNPDYYVHFVRIADETERAFKVIGISIPQSSLLDFAKMVAEKTALNINSMLADKRTGRGTEIDFILGYLLSKVDSAQFPNLQGLYQTIKTLTLPQTESPR